MLLCANEILLNIKIHPHTPWLSFFRIVCLHYAIFAVTVFSSGKTQIRWRRRQQQRPLRIEKRKREQFSLATVFSYSLFLSPDFSSTFFHFLLHQKQNIRNEKKGNFPFILFREEFSSFAKQKFSEKGKMGEGREWEKEMGKFLIRCVALIKLKILFSIRFNKSFLLVARLESASTKYWYWFWIHNWLERNFYWAHCCSERIHVLFRLWNCAEAAGNSKSIIWESISICVLAPWAS